MSAPDSEIFHKFLLNQEADMRLRKLMVILPLGNLILGSVTLAQDKPSGKVHGYAFGDYYYIIQHSDSLKRDLNGFQFRRIYLSYYYKFSEKFVSQFLLE